MAQMVPAQAHSEGETVLEICTSEKYMFPSDIYFVCRHNDFLFFQISFWEDPCLMMPMTVHIPSDGTMATLNMWIDNMGMSCDVIHGCVACFVLLCCVVTWIL